MKHWFNLLAAGLLGTSAAAQTWTPPAAVAAALPTAQPAAFEA
nr:hypothetical protein [Tanacetum cinerariifolium]